MRYGGKGREFSKCFGLYLFSSQYWDGERKERYIKVVDGGQAAGFHSNKRVRFGGRCADNPHGNIRGSGEEVKRLYVREWTGRERRVKK